MNNRKGLASQFVQSVVIKILASGAVSLLDKLKVRIWEWIE